MSDKILIVNWITGERRYIDPTEDIPEGFIPTYESETKLLRANYFPLIAIIIIVFLLLRNK